MSEKQINPNIKKFNLKKFVKFIVIFIVFITIISLYSRFIATKGLVVKEYKIVNENFIDNFYGLKIIQISDIHYGLTTDNDDLDKIVNEINLLKPDIVVFTGDLYSIDLSNEQIEELTTNLKNIKANISKYAIKGNHDDKLWEDIIKNADFIDLNKDYDLIYNKNSGSIFIAGINTEDEPIDSMEKINQYLNQNDNLESNTEENNKQNIAYKILLLHKPDEILEFDYSNYDLILGGHSHNGQVRLPFIGALYVPEGSKKYYDEYYKLNNTELYISSGIGTSKLKFRLFNKPSINLYRLVSK